MLEALDWLVYWWYRWDVGHHLFRTIFIFSSLFVIPVGAYTLVNSDPWGVLLSFLLLAGSVFGWAGQEMTKPLERDDRPGGGGLPGG